MKMNIKMCVNEFNYLFLAVFLVNIRTRMWTWLWKSWMNISCRIGHIITLRFSEWWRSDSTLLYMKGKKIIAFSAMTLQFLLYFARSVNQSRLVTKIMIIDKFVIFIFDFSCWTIKCDPRGFLKNILRSNFNSVSTYHLEYLFTPFLFNYNNRLSFVSIFFLLNVIESA